MQRLLSLTRSNDAELYGWLATACAAIHQGSDPRHALGFAGRRAIRNRDAALAALAREIAPGQPAHAQAGCLADAIERAGYTEDAISLRIRQLSAYGHIPKTQRHLYNILRR